MDGHILIQLKLFLVYFDLKIPTLYEIDSIYSDVTPLQIFICNLITIDIRKIFE